MDVDRFTEAFAENEYLIPESVLVQAFCHYVARQGPNAEWKYDKRRMSEVGDGEGR